MGTFTWNGGSGNWTDGNWTISGPSAQPFPTATDVVFVDAPGTYTLTISIDAAHDLTVNDSAAEVDQTTTFGDLTLGGSLTVDAGTFNFKSTTSEVGAATIVNDGTFESTGLGLYSTGITGSQSVANNGDITVDGDQLTVVAGSLGFANTGLISVSDFGGFAIRSGAALDNTGLMTLANGATITVVAGGGTSTAGTIQFLDGSPSKLFLEGGLTGPNTTISDFQPGNTIDLTGSVEFQPSETATVTSNALKVFEAGSLVYTIPQSGTPITDTVSVTDNGSGSAQLTIACFAQGTRILTSRGEVPVEWLVLGDLVRTSSSGDVPLRWIGQRCVDCSRHPRPDRVWPVRIRASAFSNALPRRDLLLSPDHSIYAEEVLVPIKYLVNGTTIVQEPCERVTYFHLEFDRHEILLAEGLPAESLLPGSDRAMFSNGGGPVRLHPDFHSLAWEGCGFAPLVVTGPEIEVLRRQLCGQASRRPDLHSNRMSSQPGMESARRRTAAR